MKKFKIISLLTIAAIISGFLINLNAEGITEEPIKIFKNQKCNSCHSIKILDIEKKNKKSKAPDLSSVGSKHGPDFFVEWLQKKRTQHGKKHPIKFSGSNDELFSLIGFLVSLREGEK